MTEAPVKSTLSSTDATAAGEALQASLLDLIELSLVAKQAHWNLVGPQFRSIHLHLDELVNQVRASADSVAERAAALGVPPDGRPAKVASGGAAPDIQPGWRRDHEVLAYIVEALTPVIRRLRERIDATDKSDLVTQDLLIDVCRDLEKDHWMWQAQLSGYQQ